MVKDPGKAKVDARNLARVTQEINQPRLAMSVRRAMEGKRVAKPDLCPTGSCEAPIQWNRRLSDSWIAR